MEGSELSGMIQSVQNFDVLPHIESCRRVVLYSSSRARKEQYLVHRNNLVHARDFPCVRVVQSTKTNFDTSDLLLQ